MAPDAMAACVPNDAQADMAAPAIAPQIAPKLLLHGTSFKKKNTKSVYVSMAEFALYLNLLTIPSVKTPNVVPAAIADNDVATLKHSFI